MSGIQIWLMRHGETAWSLSGAHTGRTDLPLTETGEKNAADLGRWLACKPFTVVLTSPMLRARETCRIAGYSGQAEVDGDLCEWDYGDYEGLSTADIRKTRPGWEIWRDGPLKGERVEDVYGRAAKVIERVQQTEGDVALFAHGHILRILTACWLSLPPDGGKLFAMGTGSVSTLGHEREQRVITRWNQPVI